MATLAEQASKLLDFGQKLDITLLDSIVACMYGGIGEQQKVAQEVLNTLKEHPDAWTRVDTILEYSQNQETKFYALQILEQVIKTRWKVLPRNQCEGIKKYIVGLIIKTSSDPEIMDKSKVYLRKLNIILVQILKREWPKNWESFIGDIVGASKTNESLCQNNMVILQLLSEEVFDFSSGQMTQTKAKHLKDTMCSEFSQVFHLCQFVMDNSPNVPLVAATLETLLRFLNWIPLGYIFETKLITTLIFNEWSWKNLNTLCWAIGSISGAMHEEDEKRFLVTVIKELLGLCEQKKGKDNKAIIASNIMYVVGQYPRFLRAHWKFLKTVVNKLFEFMHETHDGVQDMACDTFIKIALKCRRHFVTTQVGETMPFIEEILSTISGIICDLQTQQVHTFYEAVGYMISAQVDDIGQKERIERYMLLPNRVWDDIISQASKNVDVLKDPEAVKQLGSILKTNVRACKALGHPYVIQLGRIYLDMLNVYKVMSENISAAIALNGEGVTNQPLIKSMRVVKRETLKLISDWISRSNDHQMVLENFIPPLLDAVLLDYQKTNVPCARESEVLSAMATIVNKLEGHITSEVPKIFDAVFECTLEMINKDFEEFPEHRTNFFLLLQAVNIHCFPAFLSIPPAQFKLVLDSIIWAFKHTMRNVADTGLAILYQLLQNIEQHEQAAQSFYQTYFTEILQHIFSVVTDTSHSAGLTMHATILAYMFTLVELGRILVPLGAIPDNRVYVQEFVASLLKAAFPHLTDNQIKITVQGLFNLDQDIPAFKEHLRDFLVQIREYTGEDDSDLYLEERESALRTAQEEKRRQQMAVPGIINPHEMPEEMQD
ncbi:GSCOCT00003883001.2-RA-CDS [Cotesia congregata]|uniref:Exportin-1 n=1 Tax=Cotesia congregata TaxID=51543 RepID=A0A8J2MP33_COTCN|nr:GSCOCT00003883001.2-RA-CDS [Cotesia congregata]CAG5099998.1 exportin1 [Cotesia congregata]